MPRGKYVNHKGRCRSFTSPEELAQSEEETSSGSEESSGEEGDNKPGSSSKAQGAKPKRAPAGQMPSSSSESEEESEEDTRGAKKGVASLIEIENPNRVVKKASQKISNLSLNDAPKPELSRREREQLEAKRERERYQKLHAQGKTTEAKQDLARLALIRQQRADAAAKREAEKKAAEEKAKQQK